jgi:DNA-binding response OmpR family regulator
MPVALVVERSVPLRLHLAAALRQLGFDVTTLAAGEAVYDEARRLTPSLICLDQSLPDIGGVELCERLRHMPETAAAGIIMMSTRRSPVDRAQAELAGADEYLAKPFDMTMFAERARRLTRRAVTEPVRMLRPRAMATA